MWGFPAAFTFAAIVVPVAAMFLFRRRSRDVQVPAVQYWVDLGRPVEVSSLSTLLRRLLSLLLQVLLVMLLVVALADPAPQRRAPTVTVIVIDVSATMTTREAGGPARIDLARREALRVLDELPPDGDVVVLAAAHEPFLKLAATRDVAAARRCVEGLAALDVDADLRRAVRSAASFVNPAFPADVVVISDFAAAAPRDLRDAWQSPARLRLAAVGTDQPDAAVTSLLGQPTDAGRKVVATVAQRGLAGRTVPVHLLVNDRRVDTQQVRLTRDSNPVTFTHAIAAGDTFGVEVEAGDALAADDRAVGICPRRDAVRVCLVTDGNPWFERALRAEPGVALRVVPRARFAGPEGDTVVVVDGPTPPLRDPGRAAGYLLVNCVDPFGWARTTGEIRHGPVTHWAAEHPSMVDIDPTVIRAGRGLGIDLSAAAGVVTEVVGAEDVRVIAALQKTLPPGVGEGDAARTVRALYWAFDLRDSDLPRRLTFPLMLWNAIDFLVDGGAAPPRESLPTGRPLQLREPPAGGAPVLLDPAGAPLPARRAGDAWVVDQTTAQGVYRRADVAGEAYALNLLSGRGVSPPPEPDSAAAEPDAPPPATVAGPFGLPRRLSWSWVLLAATVIGLAEWLLFHRRIVRIA